MVVSGCGSVHMALCMHATGECIKRPVCCGAVSCAALESELSPVTVAVIKCFMWHVSVTSYKPSKGGS